MLTNSGAEAFEASNADASTWYRILKCGPCFEAQSRGTESHCSVDGTTGGREANLLASAPLRARSGSTVSGGRAATTAVQSASIYMSAGTTEVGTCRIRMSW